jgi:AcrR family transcriptional regulator
MVLSATEHPSADPERVRILDAAERLFYAYGLQQVGMDQVRGEAGVSLKRLYREFPSKEQLIEAYLLRRDARWLNALRAAVGERLTTEESGAGVPAGQRQRTATERILAAFDWLGAWFAEPGFRGCAFTNSFGELGTESSAVAAIAVAHKAEFRAVFVDLASRLAGERPGPGRMVTPGLGEQLYLLAEGAITAAGVSGDPGTARTARAAAATLITASGCPAAGSAAAQHLGNRLARMTPFRLIRRRFDR